MRDFLVLKEFLKDDEIRYLSPEIQIYEILELLEISKKNYYVSDLLAEKVEKKHQANVKIFLIFFFNYLSKGHIRCNLALLKIDIEHTLEYALVNLDKDQKNHKILENKIKKLFGFANEKEISQIISILKQNNILKDLNKENKIETPLVLENNMYLYTQKNYRQEEELIKNILFRTSSSNKSSVNEKDIIYDAKKENLSPEQVSAIKKSLKSNFFVLSGGPGTGKTTTIHHILKAISNNLGKEHKKVALVAPTGKASQKLKDSIPSSFENLELEYKTIHKLLKLSFINKRNFYTEENPLEFDIIIIDEASMIDLDIFLKLFKASKKDAKLIMIGDREQLPSINEGNVYSSLIEMKNLNEENVEVLKTNFRSNKEINTFANAISEENESIILSLINNLSTISLKEINKINKEKYFEEYIKKLYKNNHNFNLNSLKVDELDLIFNSLLDNVILSSKNFGEFGTLKINEIIKTKLRKIYGWNLEGQIIMINKNDYKNDLFNGERGILFKENSKIYALFKREEKIYKKINFSLLSNYELSFAITIHKSQGSEYKNVHIILEDNPFLTKELFYTAVTRAKEKIDIVSNEEIIMKTIKNKIERDSKLIDYINSTQTN